MEQARLTSGSSSHNGAAGPGEGKDDSKHLANALTQTIVVPMALKATLELGIPDILAKAEGRRPMSAADILAKLPTKSTGPSSFGNLRRLLRPLVKEGVFSLSFNDEQEPVYGLTEISKWYIKDNELSLAPYSALKFSPQIILSYSRLHEVILDDRTSPFEAALGMPPFAYAKKDPQFGALFDEAMTSSTRCDEEELMQTLQHSGWLDGVQTFVDVGGGQGRVVGQVVAQIGQIQGINFELPHVVHGSPHVNGVQHVAGNFFQSVPSGNVMFLKYIIHNYDDEKATKILENCFDALPTNGKVIVADCFLIESNSGSKAMYVDSLDLIMLTLLKGARERTEAEYQSIMAAAGFSLFSVIRSPTGMDLIQGVKE